MFFVVVVEKLCERLLLSLLRSDLLLVGWWPPHFSAVVLRLSPQDLR